MSITLSLKSDPSRPGGGYAILRVEGGAAPSAVAIEDRSSGLYLARGGKWTKQPNYFDIEPVDATDARLGPEIVDHVEADTILALHSAGAGVLGILVWPAIRPSAGASNGNVIDEPVASDAAGITTSPTATGASAAAEEAVAAALAKPLPAPPPPMSETRPGFAAPPPAAKGLSLRNALLIANGLAVVIIALFLFRGTEIAKGLVCEPTGALHGVSFAHALVSCPEAAEIDTEQKAYNDYLQCLPGKAACAQISCSDIYLSGFTNGAQSVQVKSARTESQKSCGDDAQKKTAAELDVARKPIWEPSKPNKEFIPLRHEFHKSVPDATSGKLEVFLAWHTLDDLDLVITCPGGRLGAFGGTFGGSFGPGVCGDGNLDVDANRNLVMNIQHDPVEHIVWHDDPPAGNYLFSAQIYKAMDGPRPKNIPFEMTMSLDGEQKKCTGTLEWIPRSLGVRAPNGGILHLRSAFLRWKTGDPLPNCNWEWQDSTYCDNNACSKN
ncbi:hypothetical protein [uncultured Rhodoblastus sp.]|uniref:hypothetical protein n=1 Tax=uncultured Rhodoblastus sp. TaxID=543037 RepID=UPI0025EE7967|nr:hypothetical protein [uncultured Rhodoblastus sp.]